LEQLKKLAQEIEDSISKAIKELQQSVQEMEKLVLESRQQTGATTTTTRTTAAGRYRGR